MMPHTTEEAVSILVETALAGWTIQPETLNAELWSEAVRVQAVRAAVARLQATNIPVQRAGEGWRVLFPQDYAAALNARRAWSAAVA